MPYPRDRHSGRRVQYAALPYRIHRDGVVQVRLITSRETRRWVIPKGWPIKNLSPPKAAARETYEEAGLVGTVSREPLGIYTYEKRLGLRSVLCDVLVFPLKVKRMLQKFPEQSQRFGVWFTIESAAAAVQEEDLKALILAFGDAIARKQAKARDKRKGADDDAAAAAGEAAPPETVEADKPPKKASRTKPAKAKPRAAEPPEAGEPPADATAGAPAARNEMAAEALPAPEKAVKPIVRPKAGKAKAWAEIGVPQLAAAVAAGAAGKAEKKAKAKAGTAKPKASGKKAAPVAGQLGKRILAADAQAAIAPIPVADAVAGKAEKKAKTKAGTAKPKASGKKALPEAVSVDGTAKGPAAGPAAKPAALPAEATGEADGKGKAAAKGKAAGRRGKEPVAVE